MTQVPLKVLITNSKLLEHPDIAEQLDKMQKAGHAITIDESLSHYDFITGPNCWLLRPEVSGLFTLAVTNARRIANADQERLEQVKLTKASKRTTKSVKPAGKRSRKVKGTGETGGPSTVDTATLFDTDQTGQLNGSEGVENVVE